ncbi:MAG: NYN domain-containing protein [Armatimonadetes bacterium]|nr:NYN domain-containing protein [Armatimonadota bacterium]
MATNVYVDGFNLYYGALKNTPYRWLNLSELCRLLLPHDQINHIKYYTAKVKPLPKDPDQPLRQQVYLRALTTLPNVEIFHGQFLSHVVRMPLADLTGFAQVIKAEEKGSDVALAAHLVHDAHKGDYDTAVIISNDSDLVPPIRIVREELGKKVGILCPYKHRSFELLSVVAFMKRIRPSVLQASQFPDTITDGNGTFHRPASW